MKAWLTLLVLFLPPFGAPQPLFGQTQDDGNVIQGAVYKVEKDALIVARQDRGRMVYERVLIPPGTRLRLPPGGSGPLPPGGSGPRASPPPPMNVPPPGESYSTGWLANISKGDAVYITGHRSTAASEAFVATEVSVRPGGCPEGPPCPGPQKR